MRTITFLLASLAVAACQEPAPPAGKKQAADLARTPIKVIVKLELKKVK